ncbi:hypothetical protein ONZ45_g14802 [Pleurotus djamor]|nr:hypothetical protein ONZ45_g14802 [Pleurotus djamor]
MLHATFMRNPALAKYTDFLTVNPFSGKARHVDGWSDLEKIGWDELRGILPFFTNVKRVSVHYSLVFPSEILHGLPATVQLTHLEIMYSDEGVLSLLMKHSNLQFASFGITRVSSATLTGPVIDLPRLVSLEAGVSLWEALFPRLSRSSLSAVRHLSISVFNAIPPPIPTTLTLNNLLSLRLSSEDPGLIAQFSRHLHSVKHLSIDAVNEDISDIDAIFDIPSRSLVYIYLLLDREVHPPTIAALFEQFPKLTIVDWEFSDNYMGGFTVVLSPVKRGGRKPVRKLSE